MKFSVLLSIYHKEDPLYFNRSMYSIWDEQSVRPDEIVLVEDGPLTEPLYNIIAEWKEKLGEALVIVRLKENAGLGEALNRGLQQCRYELVARMDTDDIALPERFETQLKVFEKDNVDICSAWISEFDQDESEIISSRKVPKTHDEIVQFAKSRNPLNHPAVMYRKSKVLEAGGYRTMLWFEDYYLWVRMILSGARFYNIQKSLVHMRSGEAQLERRRGLTYGLKELSFQKRLLDLKFITSAEYVKNISLRFTARIVPSALTKRIYQLLRR